jgi:hypothetical protein
MKANAIDPSRKKDVARYLEIPSKLSHNNPDWFPALRSSTAFDLSRRHPFYAHSEAAFFTVGDPADPVGRIAVMENRNFNRYHNTRLAFFTHFECADDPVAAKALFDAATAWAAARGLDRLAGPVGFLQTDARGMMVAGHGRMASFALPYSPPYYAGLMDSMGFTKWNDYLSGELQRDFRVSERVATLARQVKERSRMELRQGTSRAELRTIGSRLLEVYQESGTASPLYYPLTAGEQECILGQLRQTAHPKLIHWLEKDGRICGVHMALPNYMEALRRGRGGSLMRAAAFLRQRRRPQAINLTTAYIRPEHHMRGLNLLPTMAFQQAALKLGCRRALVGPILEQNTRILNEAKKGGVEFDIRHRLFEKEIA